MDLCLKYYFNYGFSTNEFKWQRIESEKSVKVYDKPDNVVDLFNSWSVPINGDTLLWEVYDPLPGDTKVELLYFQSKPLWIIDFFQCIIFRRHYLSNTSFFVPNNKTMQSLKSI